MANRRAAFNSSMEDLKKRIQYHSSNRMNRTAQDPVHGGQHEEPDGDEDEQGNEPPGPEESEDDELGEGGVRKFHKLPPPMNGDPSQAPELTGERNKWKKEAEPMLSCRSCNADVGKEDKFCRTCGDRR
jgi:hypothetical protein